MFSLGTLKPLLTTLLLPPGGLLLLLLLACILARKFRRLAWAMVITSTAAFWVLSCDATAYALNHRLLTSYAPFNIHTPNHAQAIVVLGGGVDLSAPEYGGGEELSNTGYKRLAYATYLAKHTHLPLLYAGGKGWGASATQAGSEAEVAALAAKRDFNMSIEWLDNESRDTRENATRSFDMLSRLGKTHILLVTNDWHMQRSLRNFQQAGFEVTPAPMDYLQPPVSLPIDYLPTANGLRHSYWVLREWLGLVLT